MQHPTPVRQSLVYSAGRFRSRQHDPGTTGVPRVGEAVRNMTASMAGEIGVTTIALNVPTLATDAHESMV